MTEKVYVIHENLEWTNHLVKWLEEKEVPYELWDLSSGIINLQNEPPKGIFYNRMSASSHTRNHRFAPEYTEQVLTWLEAHGRTVINGVDAINLEISKVKQYLKLNQAGIATPKTVAVLGKENILDGARQLNTYPLITKHNRAGKGLGVQLFDNEAALEAYINSPAFEPSVDGITLLQEYIKPFDGRIRRSEFINQQFLYTVSIDSIDGFQLCPADECQIGQKPQQLETSEKFEITDPLPDSQRKAYEQFLVLAGIEVAAIEWLQSESGQIYVYDVNTNTNYNPNAEERANIFAHEHLAEFLKESLEKEIVK
ncbi:ATP-grasp domain-containing protein [Streptococcus pluranimalium]|uniref:ATP-grasp domain-containing protein n=1 Tax=Streptococcus pluranimalium TaxID=82348 RepID=UPI0024155DB0|nr:alpha-L-glutamate ligase [Streptococcus pluranimalium]WFM80655.1 alpha-L-glutamate ligase [Streptococcus pluranimalium]